MNDEHTLKLTTDEVEVLRELLDGETPRGEFEIVRIWLKVALIRQVPLDPDVLEHYEVDWREHAPEDPDKNPTGETIKF